MNKSYALGVLFAAAGLFVSSAARSDQNRIDRVVELRHAAMVVQAGTLPPLAAMVTGKAPYDPTRAQVLADRAVVLAQIFTETFPEESKVATNTHTRPEVWTEWSTFSQLMTEYVDKTAAVAAAAKNGTLESLKPAILDVGRVCRNCHERYELLP